MERYSKKLIGITLNRITVLEFDSIRGTSHHAYFKCLCICGKEFITRGSRIKKGDVKSCGCLRNEINHSTEKSDKARISQLGKNNSNYKHGESKSRLFIIYMGIKSRCNNEKDISYKYYGARGIKCNFKSYEEFRNHILKEYTSHIKKNGEKKTTIDRIDSNKNYCSNNIRCATIEEQMNNRRDTIFLEYNGIRDTLRGWATRTGIPLSRIRHRYAAKMDISKILKVAMSHDSGENFDPARHKL